MQCYRSLVRRAKFVLRRRDKLNLHDLAVYAYLELQVARRQFVASPSKSVDRASVSPRIVWTRFWDSGGLFKHPCLTGFEG